MMRDLKIDGVSHMPGPHAGKMTQRPKADFGRVIKGAIQKVNSLQRDSNRSIIDLLQGKTNVPETMIAIQKADLSMRLLLNVRNKVLEAYREIMHMQF